MKSFDLKKAVSIIKNGGLVVYPTETCYGVGVLASNEAAVKKLLSYKKRPEGKAISIAVNSAEMAYKYVEINKEARAIYEKFLPGPVTVVSKSKGKVVKELEAEDGTLGVRFPDYKLALEFISKVGEPITATSANSSGKKTPYSISDIKKNVSKRQWDMIDYIIDVGELPRNPPSTVINTTKTDMQVLRRGEVFFKTKGVTSVINSEDEMIEKGSELIKKYKNLLAEKCIMVMFNADLGAGKTHFTKGMAKELGIKEIVKSPTYSLIKEYQYRIPGTENKTGNLIHIDAWRLENVDELDSLKIDEYLKSGNIIAVEWAGATEKYFDKIKSKKDLIALSIEIQHKSRNSRELTIYEAN